MRTSPLVIPPPASDSDFVDVLRLVFARYKHFIEESGGWKLLWNDGNRREKPEEAAQLLFKGVAQSYCVANNIVIDREVNLGTGLVDFKFSNGYRRRAHLEVKKLHNGKFWHGLSAQLPTYLRSDECDLGWYVVVQYHDGGSSKGWLTDGPEIVSQVALENGLRLQAVNIDGRPRLSASKL